MTKIASERATSDDEDKRCCDGGGEWGGAVFLLESQDVHYTSYLNIV